MNSNPPPVVGEHNPDAATRSSVYRDGVAGLFSIVGGWELLRLYSKHAPQAWVVPEVRRRLSNHFSTRDRRFVTRTSAGFRIAGDTRDFVQRFIFLFGTWEPNLSGWLRDSLRPGDVFVDVGANIGFFSLLAAQAVGKAGRVVAVEASPGIFAILQGNLALNRADNVRAVNNAASDLPGRLRLFRAPASNLGASSTIRADGFLDEGEVEARPLHELLDRDEGGRARVVKIDVEGAEAAVIKGLLPLLCRSRRDLELVVEVGGGPPGSPSAAESAAAIALMLGPEGFHAYQLENDYHPESYPRTGELRRPRRARDLASLVGECDLVFSRRDVAEL